MAQKLTIDGAQELLSGIGGVLGGLKGMAAGLFGGNIVAKFLGMLREPAEHFWPRTLIRCFEIMAKRLFRI